MKYTEKEQKGIDKVASMNRFFDKILMPTIGVLMIITLLMFIAGRVKEKFGSSESQEAGMSGTTAVSSDSTEALELMALRRTLLAGYAEHADAFADYGYEPAEGYAQDLALRKQVDGELVIYQFADGTMGDFTIVKYAPSADDGFSYVTLSLTVSSETLLNVSLKGEEFDYKVTFTSTDFSTHQADDEGDYRKMMKLISTDDLTAMYDIFVMDLKTLERRVK